MSAFELLRVLTSASEKAADIARYIRNQPELLALLIEEKSDEQKNKRFGQDFKTLADVLIQETVKFIIRQHLPKLSESVLGEEDGRFTNTVGESASVTITDNSEDTASILYQLLDQNASVSKVLTEVVHSPIRPIDFPEDDIDKLQDLQVNMDKLAVWIDPIDATAEYIGGKFGESGPSPGLSISGLPCVTVLVGVFNVDTGRPVLGVVNQPFYSHDPATGTWSGRLYWGYSDGNIRVHSNTANPDEGATSALSRRGRPLCLLSGSESARVTERVSKVSDVAYVRGAGYKLLCVCLGLADVYLLSSSSIYQWDTCAPAALLRACSPEGEGRVLRYRDAVAGNTEGGGVSLGGLEVRYGTNKLEACHQQGLIVYRSKETLTKILAALQNTMD